MTAGVRWGRNLSKMWDLDRRLTRPHTDKSARAQRRKIERGPRKRHFRAAS